MVTQKNLHLLKLTLVIEFFKIAFISIYIYSVKDVCFSAVYDFRLTMS